VQVTNTVFLQSDSKGEYFAVNIGENSTVYIGIRGVKELLRQVSNPIAFIKILRGLYSLPLRESKDIYDFVKILQEFASE
jgi:hypothetical protein